MENFIFVQCHHFIQIPLNDNNLLKKMNKQVNQDANELCPNIIKTEVFLFKSARKQTNVSLKLALIRKRLYPTNQ